MANQAPNRRHHVRRQRAEGQESNEHGLSTKNDEGADG